MPNRFDRGNATTDNRGRMRIAGEIRTGTRTRTRTQKEDGANLHESSKNDEFYNCRLTNACSTNYPTCPPKVYQRRITQLVRRSETKEDYLFTQIHPKTTYSYLLTPNSIAKPSPFGVMLENRHFQAEDYRYGFNGMELESNFTNATASHYDFGARIYDARLGRWLSCDPMQVRYPDLSPYNFCANIPILFVDPDGRAIRIADPNNPDSEPIIYKPGDPAPEGASDFVMQTWEALNYLNKNPLPNINIVSYLVNDNQNYDIQFTSEPINNKFSPGDEGSLQEDKVIKFNPSYGMVFEDGKSRSALLALAHELDHAYFFAWMVNVLEDLDAKEKEASTDEEKAKISKEYDDWYTGLHYRFWAEPGTPGDIKEENRAATNYEAYLAKMRGEKVRTDYYSKENYPTKIIFTGNVFSSTRATNVGETEKGKEKTATDIVKRNRQKLKSNAAKGPTSRPSF